MKCQTGGHSPAEQGGPARIDLQCRLGARTWRAARPVELLRGQGGSHPAYLVDGDRPAAAWHQGQCPGPRLVQDRDQPELFFESAKGLKRIARLPARRGGRIAELVGPVIVLAIEAGSLRTDQSSSTTAPFILWWPEKHPVIGGMLRPREQFPDDRTASQADLESQPFAPHGETRTGTFHGQTR